MNVVSYAGAVSPCGRVWYSDRRVTLMVAVAAFLIIFFGMTTISHAAGLDVAHATAATGTGPFDTTGNCPTQQKGDDCSANDDIVRTNDTVAYLWSVSTGSITETNVTLTGTIEAGMTWQAPIPAPCTGAGSGISADGLTLVCVVPQITPDTSMDILPIAKVDYDTENGETNTATLTVASDDCPEETPPDTTVTVSAAPQLDLEKKNPGNGGIAVDANGDSGIVYFYPVSVLMANGGKGSEIVNPPITFTDDLSGYPAGSKLYDWNGKNCGQNEQYYNHNGIPKGTGGGDRGVTDSGTWACVDNGGSIAVTITGADLTGQHLPIEDRDGTTLAADKAYVVAGIIPIWVPIEAIKDAGGLRVTNVVTDFDPDSISDESNFLDDEEPIDNNDHSHYIPAGDGYFQKYFQKSNGQLPTGQTQWKSGDGIVGPGEDFRARIYARNRAILPWENFIYCDKIDTSTYYLRPNASGDATTFSVHTNPVMPLTEGTDFVVEYGSVANQQTSTCDNADSPNGWYASTNAYLAANPADTLQDDINAVRVRFLTDFQPQQKFSLFTNLTTRTDVPNGTILPNYANYYTDTLRDGEWSVNNFDPEEYRNIGLGDRVTMSRGSVRITKDSSPTDVESITAGDAMSYSLRWTATSETSANLLDVIITDTLPAEMTYTGATPAPTTIINNVDGTTTLVWRLGDVQENTSGTIIVNTISDEAIPNLMDKINDVIISSPTDASPDEFREDEYTVKILNFAAMQTRKTTSTPLIGQDESFDYTIFYRNVGKQYFPAVDIIDVFPYIGDGRTPSTSFTGQITLTAVTPGSTGDLYFTNAAPGGINADPADSSNALGTGSIWCTAAQLGVVAGCPAANYADVTAIRFVDQVQFPAFDPIRNIKIEFASQGNIDGDVYTNSFSARADGLTLPVKSNQVPVKVLAAAYLDITKVADVEADSCMTADQELTYTIVVTNIGRGPACEATFIDTIPANSTYVGGSFYLDGVLQSDPTGSVTFPVTGTGDNCADGRPALAIGESFTVQFSVLPDPNYNGNLLNQAHVNDVVDLSGNEYNDVPDSYSSIDADTLEDDTVVCTKPEAPDITVLKNNDANQDGVFTDSETYSGALPITVPYLITITNDSVSDMTITSIGDDTHAIGACASLLNTVVPGNDAVSCQFDVTYTEDIQSVVNIFNVTAENDGGTDADEDPSTVTIPDLTSSIEVTKEANKATVLENGENVQFVINVENTSLGDTVVITEVIDTVFGDVGGSCAPSLPATIEPTETVVCTFTRFVGGNAGDLHENTATAKGTDDDGKNLEDSDDETVEILDRPSAIAVTKTADPIRVQEPGENVTFTVGVQNISAADTVTITSVIDSVFGDVGADCAPALPAVLAPKETISCQFVRFIGDNAYDVHTNTVTASGVDDDGETVEDDDDARVDVDDIPSALQVLKTATPTVVLENGDDVTFTVTVENISAVDPITVTVVNDSVFGDITSHCLPAIPVMLNPSDTITCTFNETITGNAGYQHYNIVTASGYDDDGAEPSDDDDATVDVIDVPSSMEVTKVADPVQVYELGDDVTFTVSIENTSPSDTITVTDVMDDVFGDISGSCLPAIPAEIAPDATITCTFVREITGNAGYVHTNTVTANATDDDGETLQDDDDATVEVLNVPSAIEVLKVATPNTLFEPGGDVTFTVTVKNISPVDTVVITSVVDSVFGDISSDCGGLPATLLVTQVLTCTFTRELIGEAWDVHTNTVTAEGVDDDGETVSDDDDEEVDFENVPSSIKVTKIALPSSVAEPGADVAFTVMVENTSLVDTVTITSVVDSVFGDVGSSCAPGLPADIAPTEMIVCTFVEFVGGEAWDVHTNTVTAEGVDDDGETVTDDDDETVDITNLPPAIVVNKVADKAFVIESGEDVTFTVTIENVSVEDDVTINTVVDDVFGDIGGSCAPSIPATIAPSGIITCTFTRFLAGDIEGFHENTVTATGVSDDGEPVSDDDDEQVAYDDELPLLDVDKTAHVQSVPEPGADVTFTVTVENKSPADTITVTTVIDDVFGDISAGCLPAIPAVIVPGEMITCTFTEYIAGNAGDVHTNTVTANGIDDDNTPVEDSDDEDVDFTDVPSSIKVIKNAEPTAVLEPGANVTFTIDVINTSAVDTVTITQVIDDVFGDISAHCPTLPMPLAPAETLTCTFVEYVEGNAGEQHHNTVVATGYDNDGSEPTDDDDATVDFLDVPSSMRVTKLADPTQIFETQEMVTFTVEVRNTSLVDTITITQVTDDIFGDISASCDQFPAVLAPDAFITCTFTELITGNAGDQHLNTVTANAIDDDGESLDDSDDATVDILDVPSAIEVEKMASTGAILEPGADVTFTVSVKNVSLADSVTINEVVDSIFGDVSAGCEHTLPYTMTVNETMTCTFVEYIAGNAGDVHTNTVTANGVDDDGTTVTDSDDEDVTTEDVPSSMEVEKTADPVVVFERGDDVEFTVIVRNTSTVDTITVTQVIDDIFGNIGNECDVTLPAQLAVGGFFTCTFTRFVGGNAGDQHHNTVTADALDDDGNALDDNDDAIVDILDLPSSIDITKTATPDAILEPGADVTFGIVVVNTSAADAVTITQVTDSVFGDVSSHCAPALPTILEPTETVACTFTEFVAGNAGDVHQNTATATATDDDGNEINDSDDEEVPVGNVTAEIAVTKTADPVVMTEPGGNVQFTIVVSNSSPVDPVPVETVVDDIFGDISSTCTVTLPVRLDVGESFTCTFSAPINGNAGYQHVNVVTANGTSDDGESVTDNDDATVDIIDVPSVIDVNKTASTDFVFEPGADVTFTVSVYNGSPVDSVVITNVVDSVFGDISSVCGAPITLAPSEQVDCTFMRFIGGNAGDVHHNVVTATGSDDDGNPVTDDDDETVDILDVDAALRVTKDVDTAVVLEPGDDVTFTVVVANISPTDMVTVNSVIDDIFGDISASCAVQLPYTLAIGEAFSCVFSEMIAGNAGDQHHNTVTAAGIDDDGNPLSDDDDAIVDIIDVPSAIQLTKTASDASIAEPGGDVVFTIEVENLSAADNVTINEVIDSVFGDISASCNHDLPHTLAPSMMLTCVFSEYLAGNANDIHTNIATANGIDDDGNQLTSSDAEEVLFDGVPSSINVTKAADVQAILEPGADVVFTIVVENTSSVDSVTINEVIDSMFGDVSASCEHDLPHTLAPAASMTCTFTEYLAGNASDIHTNVATANGIDDDGDSVTGKDDEIVRFDDVPSALALTKTADQQTIPEPGADVVFTIAVVNTSTIDDVTINEVVDSVFGDVSASCEHDLPHTLAPAASMTCTFTEYVMGNANDIHTNVATANGIDDDGNLLSADDDEVVGFTDVPSVLTVVKTAAQPLIVAPGADVLFTINVQNSSAVDSVTVNEITDSVFPDADIVCEHDLPHTLAPAAAMACSFTGYVAGTGGDVHTNVVTARGTDDDGNAVTGDDDATVYIEAPVIIEQPLETSIAIDKSAAVPSVEAPGENVLFTVIVTNTSEAAFVVLDTLTDNIYGAICTDQLPYALAAGEAMTCTFTGVVSGPAGGIHTNIVTGSAHDLADNILTADDDATVLITKRQGELSLVVDKTAAVQSVQEPGSAIRFTVVVTNTSEFDALTITSLDDNLYGGICAEALPITLAVNEAMTCEFTGVVSGSAGDTHINVVTAVGESPAGDSVTADDDATVLIVTPTPQLGQIGDFIWFDSDDDGTFNGEDYPLEGVVVKLYDENGTMIGETTTDETGHYVFANIPVGSYEISVLTPMDELIPSYDPDSELPGSQKCTCDNSHTVALSEGETYLGGDYAFTWGQPTAVTALTSTTSTASAMLVVLLTGCLLSLTVFARRNMN